MYAWKCWHDSRDRVIPCATASLAIGLMFGAIALAEYHVWLSYDWRRILHRMPWYFDLARSAWDWGLGMAEESLFPAAVWLALSLGTMSVGREYRSGAMPFLLTRPASRKAFVWTDWSVGLAEMTVILALMVVGAVSVLCNITPDYIWLSFPALLESVVLGAASAWACAFHDGTCGFEHERFECKRRRHPVLRTAPRRAPRVVAPYRTTKVQGLVA